MDRIDVPSYLPERDCGRCGYKSCRHWLRAIKEGRANPSQCPSLPQHLIYPIQVVLELDQILPSVEVTMHPQPGHVGLLEINGPTQSSPVLVTGNSTITQEVVLAVLSTTSCGFYLLCVDCQGHTVDMALIYDAFRPSKVDRSLQESNLSSRTSHRVLTLPGVLSGLRGEIEDATGWKTVPGPFCIGELPLFHARHWTRPPSCAAN